MEVISHAYYRLCAVVHGRGLLFADESAVYLYAARMCLHAFIL